MKFIFLVFETEKHISLKTYVLKNNKKTQIYLLYSKNEQFKSNMIIILNLLFVTNDVDASNFAPKIYENKKIRKHRRMYKIWKVLIYFTSEVNFW